MQTVRARLLLTMQTTARTQACGQCLQQAPAPIEPLAAAAPRPCLPRPATPAPSYLHRLRRSCAHPSLVPAIRSNTASTSTKTAATSVAATAATATASASAYRRFVAFSNGGQLWRRGHAIILVSGALLGQQEVEIRRLICHHSGQCSLRGQATNNKPTHICVRRVLR